MKWLDPLLPLRCLALRIVWDGPALPGDWARCLFDFGMRQKARRVE